VRVNDKEFQPVYGFGHRDKNTESTFYQIFTESSDEPLELSGDHLIFRHGHSIPVPATMIQTGDMVQRGGSPAPSMVTNVKTLVRSGIYAPFTESGTLVVNGVVASTFVTFQQDQEYMVIGGMSTGWSYHTLSLFWNKPYQFYCTRISSDMCKNQVYAEGGVALWSYIGKSLGSFMSESSTPFLTVLQALLFVFVLPILILIFGLVGIAEHGFLFSGFFLLLCCPWVIGMVSKKHSLSIKATKLKFA